MATLICIAGKNMIAVEAMARLSLDHDVVCLPNPEDDGEDGWQPSLKRAALDHGVPLISQAEAAAKLDLCFLSLEYSRIIRPSAFASDRLFNIHFSLLPEYRGCNTSVWPILNGEDEHGVTLHIIDAGVDTGPIIDQRSFRLDGMTAFESYMTCQRIGLDLVMKWVPRLLSRDYEARPQGEGTSYPRESLDYGLRELDLSASREEVLRRIRAFTFPAYQFPTLQGREIEEWSASPFPGASIVQAADGPVYLKFGKARAH